VIELEARFLSIQALEAVRCLEEGVVSDPVDADLGSVLGWGFPAWTGGALSYIETVGLAPFVEQCQRLARRWGPRFRPTSGLKARAERNEPFYGA